MRLSRVILPALVAALLAAAPSSASTASLPLADAENVGLEVRTSGPRLCLTLTGQLGGNENCEHVRLVDLQDRWLSRVNDPSGKLVGGATNAFVAKVRYVLPSGSVDIETQALPELRGRIGAALRFYVGQIPDAYVRRVLLLGEDGTVLGEPMDMFQDVDEMPAIRSERSILAGRDWRVSVRMVSIGMPLPGAPLHRTRLLCTRGHISRASGQERCEAVDGVGWVADPTEACRAGRRLISGMAPAAGGAVAVRLADGRAVQARRASLRGFSAPGFVAYAAEVPLDVAVRAVELARPVPSFGSRIWVPKPLGPLACRDDGGVWSIFSGIFGSPLSARSTSLVGGAALHLAESPDAVCLRLGSPPGVTDCGRAPVTVQDVLPAEGPGVVGGLVDARIAHVQIRRRDGTSITVSTEPAPPDAGPLARHLRVFGYRGPEDPAPVAVRPVAPAGESRWTTLEAAWRAQLGPVVALLGQHRLRLLTIDLDGPQGFEDQRCLTYSRSADEAYCDIFLLPDYVRFDVRCDPRRAIVVGSATAGTRRVDVVLTGGGRQSAKIIRSGPAAGVWVATVPPRRTVRAVVMRGRDKTVLRRAELPLPPATEQCGYAGSARAEPPGRPGRRDFGYRAKTAAAVSPPLVPMNDSVMITR